MKAIRLLVILFTTLVAAQSLWAQVTLMPLGDSITSGDNYGDNNAFRRVLWELLTGSGYDFDFVGSLQDGNFIERQHEGHNGWTDAQIAADVYTFLEVNPAKIVLLHIGTNGLNTNPADVERILDEIDRWENDNTETVIVILARIINRQGHVCPNPSTTTTFNNNVAAMASARINDRIVIVDIECGAGLDYQADMADLLHPNITGFSKMAHNWYAEGLLAVLPWAEAGADQRVAENEVVVLDGTGSADPDGELQYLWEQLEGTSVTLSDPTSLEPVFVAPAVGSDGGTLVFQLTVTDSDGFTHNDTVNIDIDDVLITPVADAGLDQRAAEGDIVTLDGSDSYDPDGTITNVQWQQVGGSVQVSLATANLLSTEFTAPAVGGGGGVLTFKLTIKDNDGLVSEDYVYVTIDPIDPVPPTGGGGGGGGGCFIGTISD